MSTARPPEGAHTAARQGEGAPASTSVPRRALGPVELVAQMAQLQGWTLQGDGPELAMVQRYEFANFHEVMAFANAVAWIAHQRQHHPELTLTHRQCTVRWRTHDAGGITTLDCECAAQVDALRGASA